MRGEGKASWGPRTSGSNLACGWVLLLAVNSADSDVCLTYVITLVALRAGLLLHRANLCLLRSQSHQRPVQPHPAARRQPGDGLSFCISSRAFSVGSRGVGLGA